MNDDGFFDLIPGSIGTIQYKVELKLTDEQKQDIVSQQSNARMRAWMQNMTYGMNGNNTTDPYDAYIKARNDSWGEFEDGRLHDVKTMYVQVGSEASLKDIESAEATNGFIGWTNPAFVQILKTIKDER